VDTLLERSVILEQCIDSRTETLRPWWKRPNVRFQISGTVRVTKSLNLHPLKSQCEWRRGWDSNPRYPYGYA
jgi:hypothetical protein